MKNIITNLACVLLGLALFTGCANTNSPDVTKGPMTNPGNVAILFGNPPKSFVEVGTVSTPKTQPTAGETWQHSLQKQAAARGADAVLVDNSTLDNSNSPMVTGKAIRYQ
jgi:hypothetical protein